MIVDAKQNIASFEHCDLVPNLLRGVRDLGMSVTVMGHQLRHPRTV